MTKGFETALINKLDGKSVWRNYILDTLYQHKGYKVVFVTYGNLGNPAAVCLEREGYGDVILDTKHYTFCAREEN